MSGYDAAARHLGQSLRLARVAVADIDDAVIPVRSASLSMPRHSPREGRVREVREAGAWFVEFLGECGIVRREAKVAAPVFDRRVLEFQDRVRQHRGIPELTIGGHGRMVMRLLPVPRQQSTKLDRSTHSRALDRDV